MNLFHFMSHLRSLDIQVSAENGRLKVSAPKGSITPEIKNELQIRKGEILSLLEGMGTIPNLPRDAPLPLSISQEHLWQLHRLTPDTVAYNMYAAFRLCGELDASALEAALQDVAERHIILRTSFPRSIGSNPIQDIMPSSSIRLIQVSLQGAIRPVEELQSLIEREVRQPFDLLTGPLFRSILATIGPAEYCLLFVIHHVIFDGNSFGVLYKDLERAYQARIQQQIVDWLPLPIQYADFAAWQRQWLVTDSGVSDRAYWQTQLASEVPALELPIDHPYSVQTSPEGSYVDLPIGPELYSALQDVCRRNGVTLFAVALSAFNILLHRHSGQEDQVICFPVAARDRSELSQMIGYFNNTLLLRSDLTKINTIQGLLQQTQSMVIEALAHQMFPFREVAGFPNLLRTPFSRGMIVVLDSTEQTLRLPGLVIEKLPAFSSAVQYDLSIEWTVVPGGIHGRLFYRKSLFEHQTAEQLAEEYRSILLEITDHPDHAIRLNSFPKPVRSQPELARPDYSAPQTELEHRLAQIWKEVLRVESIGIHDGFFELGGHSLLALRLFTRIEQETGTNLPLSTLFGTTTIASLAELIEGKTVEPAWDIFVPIQPLGSKPPFFSIHGIEGGVLGYRDVAIALGKDQPFLGLQAKGLDGRDVHDATVQEMASRYISVMRSHQPHGPYRIGGYCFGGVIAYEMACQLEKIGERVSVLAIFEGSMPEQNVRVPLLQRLRAIGKSLPAWARDYSGMSPRQLLNRIRSTSHKIWSKIQRDPEVERRLRVEETLDIDVDNLPSQHIQITDALMNAAVRYTPGEYNGEVILFRARNRSFNEILFGSLDPKMGWGRLANGGVKVRLVDGFHRNMHLAPYAHSLAAELKRCLDDTDREI